nr:phosphopantetheine-binding protein [Oligoflexus tunisiensis]
MNYQVLKNQILDLLRLKEEEFDPDESLIDFGMDSMQVMQLMEAWTKSGVDVSFVELAQNPTLNSWWQLIQTRIEAR